MRYTTAGLLVVMFTGGAGIAWAQADPQENELQTEATAAETELMGRPEPNRAEALAKQFGVEAATVEQLRNEDKGWGGVFIQLATAQHLTQKDPATYPTMAVALAKIQSLHAEHHGWGRIAQELGFKLGPVVSAARHARNEMRREARAAARVERLGASPGRLEKLPRPERPPRGPKPEKPPKPR